MLQACFLSPSRLTISQVTEESKVFVPKHSKTALPPPPKQLEYCKLHHRIRYHHIWAKICICQHYKWQSGPLQLQQGGKPVQRAIIIPLSSWYIFKIELKKTCRNRAFPLCCGCTYLWKPIQNYTDWVKWANEIKQGYISQTKQYSSVHIHPIKFCL